MLRREALWVTTLLVLLGTIALNVFLFPTRQNLALPHCKQSSRFRQS